MRGAPRLGCAFIPGLSLQALLRERPDLDPAAPIGVYPAEEPSARARLSAVNRAAAALGLHAGLGLPRARAIGPGAVLAPCTPAARELLFARARAAAETVAPAVEPGPAGVLYADLSDVRSLYGGEHGAAAALQAALRRAGIEGWIGVAGSRIAARAAARHGRGIEEVPEGQDRTFLAPLPLALLDASEEVRATWVRWGLATVGDFALLPRDGVGARLGPEGVRLHRIAGGEEVEPWQPGRPAEDVVESVELEWGVAQVEPLLFALRAPLDRLLARLSTSGLACGGMSFGFTLDPRGLWSREVEVAAPTREVRPLLGLVRWALTKEPPPAPVTGIRVAMAAARAPSAQLRLFGLPEAPPELLGTTLARIEALAGPGRSGAPVLSDTHFPGDESARLSRFAPPPPPDAGERVAPRGRTAAFRLFRPPRPVEVLVARGRPAALQGASLRGRVIDCAGPWTVAAAQVERAARALDCYDVALADGGTYRLVFDRLAGRWQVEGEYD